LSLKSVSLLGLVRVEERSKKRDSGRRFGNPPGGARRKRRCQFVEAEAAESDGSDDEDAENLDGRGQQQPLAELPSYLKQGFWSCEEEVSVEEEVEEEDYRNRYDRKSFDQNFEMHALNELCQGSYKALKQYGACQPGEIAVGYGGKAEGRDPHFLGYRFRPRSFRGREEDQEDEEEGDLAENSILRTEHNYASAPKKPLWSSTSSCTRCQSRGEKKIFNSIQRAVAVLGNSKKLFFGHLDVMVQGL